MKTASGSGVVPVDPDRLAYELAIRGVTQRRLAEVSGVTAFTISRAGHGRQLRPSSLGKLTAALLEIPLLPGSELLISQPRAETKKPKR